MYDSLTLFVPVDDPARLVANLDNVEERFVRRTGEVILSGRCQSLYVKTSGSGVTVAGSLSRYWFGSNFMTPTFNDCRDALQRLEGELGSLLAEMQIYRVDIAASLNVQHPCARYLRMFGTLSRFKRLERNGGLLYRTQRRELDFYDKKAEARNRKEAPPKSFNGRNALRYELRYRRQLKEQFGKRVTAQRLIEPAFYREIVSRWEASYRAIHKTGRTISLQLDTTNPKSFGASLERLGIERIGGEAVVLEELRIRRECGEIDRQTYSRLRARVLRQQGASGRGDGFEPIRELDSRVQLEVERQLSCLG